MFWSYLLNKCRDIMKYISEPRFHADSPYWFFKLPLKVVVANFRTADNIFLVH